MKIDALKKNSLFIKLAVFIIGLLALGVFWRSRLAESKDAVKEAVDKSIGILIDNLDNITSKPIGEPTERQTKIQKIIDNAASRIGDAQFTEYNKALSKVDKFLQNSISGPEKDSRIQSIADKLRYIIKGPIEKTMDNIGSRLSGPVKFINTSNEYNIRQLFEENINDFKTYTPIQHNNKEIEKMINTCKKLVHFYNKHSFGTGQYIGMLTDTKLTRGYTQLYTKTLLLNLLKDIVEMSKFTGVKYRLDKKFVVIDNETIEFGDKLDFIPAEMNLIEEEMSFGRTKRRTSKIRKSKKRSTKKNRKRNI